MLTKFYMSIYKDVLLLDLLTTCHLVLTVMNVLILSWWFIISLFWYASFCHKSDSRRTNLCVKNVNLQDALLLDLLPTWDFILYWHVMDVRMSPKHFTFLRYKILSLVRLCTDKTLLVNLQNCPTLRIPRWVVCKKHARDWWTLDFALFGLMNH